MTTRPSLAVRPFPFAPACLAAALLAAGLPARAAAPAHPATTTTPAASAAPSTAAKPATAAPAPAGTAMLPSPGPKLAGTKWEWWKLYNDDDTVVTVKEPARYVVEFREDGKLAIQADCNRGTGSWSGVSPSLKIEAAATTRMACPPGSLGDRFVKLLSLAESVEGDGRKLSVILKSREGVMGFRRAGASASKKKSATAAKTAKTPKASAE